MVFVANAGRVSLNDSLYTGPYPPQLLLAIMHRFRVNNYGLMTDIERPSCRSNFRNKIAMSALSGLRTVIPTSQLESTNTRLFPLAELVLL